MHYFSYGSVVNRHTRPSDEDYTPATIASWQRYRAHTVDDDRAAQSLAVTPPSPSSSDGPKGFSVLTIEPASEVDIDGVLVSIPVKALTRAGSMRSGYHRRTLEAPTINDWMKPLHPRAVVVDDDTRCEFDERILTARQCAVVKHR